jgi:ATP-binding cassette subfamily B protein
MGMLNKSNNNKGGFYVLRLLPRMLGCIGKYPLFTWGFLVLVVLIAVQDSVYTYISKLIIDEGIIAHNISRLYTLVGFYAGMAVLQAVGVFSLIYIAGVLGEKVNYDLRKQMFEKLQQLSLSFYSRTKTGKIISRLTSDSKKISSLMTWGLVDVSWGILAVTGSIVFMFLVHWQLALIVLCIMPVLIGSAVLFQKRIFGLFRRVRKFNSRIITAYNENIMGVRTVKAMCREKKNLNGFDRLADDMRRMSYRAAWFSAFLVPVVQIIASFSVFTIIWIGGIQYRAGGISAGSIQAFLSYMAFMIWPIQEMSCVWASLQNAMASAERVFHLIDSEPEIKDRPDARQFPGLRSTISFERVGFYYEPLQPVVSDMSFEICKGEIIALVGPTGGGKSTIINLLCRFYEPVEGRICFDDTDYRDFTLRSLQSRIGIVLQQPHLFSGTVRENIRYGKADAADAEVLRAAQQARAHDFIIRLEHGYDEELGEGGCLLSTGEKQLISIARAVISDPELFIMDEATSSIDTVTEKRIQKALKDVLRNRTSIIIAHRLSTIMEADRIMYIKEGRIVEQGSHTELLRLGGRYYKLYTVMEEEGGAGRSHTVELRG